MTGNTHAIHVNIALQRYLHVLFVVSILRVILKILIKIFMALLKLMNICKNKIGSRCASTQHEHLVIREDLGLRHAKLVEATLASHLPNIKWPPELSNGDPLPIGSFLAFFNHAVPEAELGSDGYDELQAPQWDSNCSILRRWVRGKIKFHSGRKLLIGENAKCEEFMPITSMKTVNNQKSRRKCTVTIERNITTESFPNTVAIQEARILLYYEASAPMLRRLSHAITGKRANFKQCRPAHSHSICLTDTLLFRYSALCFNAHKIHIDADYARHVENLRNTVVQGPLMVTLVLRWLSGIINPGTFITSLSYENLGSVMAGETIKLLASQTSLDQWKAWITHVTEDQAERIAFEGSVTTSGGHLDKIQTSDGRT